ncbi:signal recognition particle-docking protein FtsY [bacterium]|nr:signal recognition particle-docking protein FtsY [bacterium]
MGLFSKLKNGLTKTRAKLGGQIRSIISSHSKISEELYDELEETLITADVGIDSTLAILETLREKVRKVSTNGDPEIIYDLLTDTIDEVMRPAAEEKPLNLGHTPSVILIVGVNGSGKTTTIAKLTYHFLKQNKKVLLAAADTFRAAATEQIVEWGDRLGVQVIQQGHGADPAAVAFDALQSAKARGFDILIVDTAGRLHNKANLMHELEKIYRAMKKQDPEAPHEVFLVLDGTTGQNALQQAKIFQETSGVTGLVITKLDGTAKGGAVIPICRELGIPLRFIGIGEKMEDLEPFDPSAFARALLASDEDSE